MKYSFTKTQMGLAVSCVLALGIVSGAARAETSPADAEKLTDQRGMVTPVPASKSGTQRVTLDADTLFDFGNAVLHPAGGAALDDFLVNIKDIDPEMIMLVGHADRFGSTGYNQRLSEQRVAAVKAYLISRGIEPNRLHTEGKGETQPLTTPGECDGARSARVVACLQFDRRVEVEVVGTRIAR